MPKYEVTVPGQGTFEVSSPTDLTDAQAYAAIQAQLQSVPEPKRPEDVGIIRGTAEALKRGFESYGETGRGYGVGASSLFGTEEDVARKMAEAKAKEQEVPEQPQLTWEDMERIYKEKGLLSAIGQAPKYIAESFAGNLPQMAAPLAVGEAATALSAPVAGPLAPAVGLAAGVTTYGLQQFGNFLYRQAVEKKDPKEIEVAKAAVSAAGTAPIGYFADRFTAGLGAIPEKQALREIYNELGKRGVIKAVGKEAGKGAALGVVAEAPTEVLEQAAERWQAGLDLTGSDAMREYKEAFFGAAATGGVAGAAGRGYSAYKGFEAPKTEPPATPEVKDQVEEVKEKATPEQTIDFANQRINELQTKAKGTPDQTVLDDQGKPVTVRGQQPEYLDDREQKELSFLEKHRDNPEKIAKAYGVSLVEPTAVPEVPAAPEVPPAAPQAAQVSPVTPPVPAVPPVTPPPVTPIAPAPVTPAAAQPAIPAAPPVAAPAMPEVPKVPTAQMPEMPKVPAVETAIPENLSVKNIMDNWKVGRKAATTAYDSFKKYFDVKSKFNSGQATPEEYASAIELHNETLKKLGKISKIEPQPIPKIEPQALPEIAPMKDIPSVIKNAGIEFRNENQQRVVENFMKTYNRTPEQVAGYISQGLVKPGTLTAEGVDVLRKAAKSDSDAEVLAREAEAKKAKRSEMAKARAEEKRLVAQRMAEEEALRQPPPFPEEGTTRLEPGVPELPAETIAPKQPYRPVTQEREDLEKQIDELQQQYKKVETTIPKPTLIGMLRGRLDKRDVIDIGDEPHLNTLIKKTGRGEYISDLVASGAFDAYLPPNTGEMEGTEIIKQKIRDQNYLTQEAQDELDALGYKLETLEEDLKKDTDYEAKLDQINEELRDYFQSMEGVEEPVTGVEVPSRAGVEEPPVAAKEKRPELKVKVDNPGGKWLEEEQKYAAESGMNSFGTPRKFGSTTATLNRSVLVPVDKLAKVKGMRAEQLPENIRPESLDYLTKEMSRTGRLPQYDNKDYVPFVMVAYDGTPYVNEGNHRIMVAKKLGWKYLPIQVSWFAGGEKVLSPFSPEMLESNDAEAYSKGVTLDNYGSKAPEEFALKAETAAETKARITKEEEGRSAAEEKAIADREREAFALTPQVAEREAAPTGDLFGARGLAEQPAKPKAPAPEIKEGLFAETKPEVTEDQRKNAQTHADEVGGEVVYQKGDYALIRGYSMLTGDPVYVPTSGTSRGKVDIERFTGKQIPADVKAEMIKVKNDTERTAANKHNAEPFIKFDRGLALSKDISSDLAGVIRGWKDLLNINVPVYVSTIEDAKTNRNNFTGPHRRIGSGTLDEKERGSMRRMADGSYYILFEKSTSPTLMLETLGHEMGHLHERLYFEKASPEEQKAVRGAFDKWLASQKDKTAQELVESLRGRATARQVTIAPGQMANEMTSYWKSFGEWYADQVSRWAVSAQEPVNIVEKFFKRLANQLRQFYQRLKNAKYLPDATFVKYLESTNKEAVNLQPPSDVAERMLSKDDFGIEKKQDTEGMVQAKKFSPFKKPIKEEVLTAEGEKAKALNERMKGISNPKEKAADDTLIKRLKARFQPIDNVSAEARLRRMIVDKDAPVIEQLQTQFNNRVKDELDNIRPDLLLMQAQDTANFGDMVIQQGGIGINKDGLIEVKSVNDKDGKPVNLDRVLSMVAIDLGKKLGSPDLAMNVAHNALIAYRAENIFKTNAEIEAKASDYEAQGDARAARKLRKKIVKVRAKPEEIEAGLQALKDYPEIKEAYEMWRKYSNGLVDFLRETGRINAGTAENWKNNIGYVPWTRVEEAMNKFEMDPRQFKNGVVNLSALPELDREGSSKEINNIFDNMVGFTYWAIRSGINNYSAQKTIHALPDVSEIEEGEISNMRKSHPDRVVFSYDNGNRKAYLLANPYQLSAFSTIAPIKGGLFSSVFAPAARFVRATITHMPAFAISQLIQDGTYRGWLLSGVKNPYKLTPKVFKNFYKSLRGQKEGILGELERIGVTGLYDGMPENSSRKLRERLNLEHKSKFKKAWDALEKFSLSADLAVRAAIYEQTLEETGDRSLAYYRAKEYINFKRQGTEPIIYELRQSIPFFNAYLQGMDVLYRTMVGKGVSTAEKKAAMKLFYMTGAQLFALNMLYAAMVSGDDEYEGLDEHVRNRNYIIPGTGIKIPVAPEVGFFFKVLPEQLYRAIVTDGVERPQDANAVFKRLRNAFADAFGGVSYTPQLLKPLYEVATNYSFFLESPIVGAGMKNIDPSLQFTESTSEIAKALGSLSGISPMKLDYLIRGYTGMAGALALDLTDSLANPDRMEKPIYKLPQISTFMYDPTGRGFKSDFYQFREDIDRVTDTVNMLKREGKAEELKEFLTEENATKYAMRGVINKIENQLSKLRNYRKIIAADTELSSAERLKMTREIMEEEKELLKAYNVSEMRKIVGF